MLKWSDACNSKNEWSNSRILNIHYKFLVKDLAYIHSTKRWNTRKKCCNSTGTSWRIPNSPSQNYRIKEKIKKHCWSLMFTMILCLVIIFELGVIGFPNVSKMYTIGPWGLIAFNFWNFNDKKCLLFETLRTKNHHRDQ